MSDKHLEEDGRNLTWPDIQRLANKVVEEAGKNGKTIDLTQIVKTTRVAAFEGLKKEAEANGLLEVFWKLVYDILNRR